MEKMAKTYRTPIEVRGYELDSFGHVNHAMYVSYFEHARWKMLNAEGVTLETFQKHKRWPVIASIEIQYLRPTYMGDALVVESRLVEYKRSSMQLEQKILKGDALVTQAKIRSVFVDEAGKPAALPEELETHWRNFAHE